MNPHARTTVFDPMFTSRTRRQTAPGYVRRPTVYFSVAQPVRQPAAPAPAALRSNVAAQPAPVPQAAPASPAPLRPPQSPPGAQRTRLSGLCLRCFKRLPHVPDRRTALLYAMAAVIFVVGLSVGISGLRANHAVAAQVTHLQQQAAKVAGSPTGTSASVPSAIKPSPATVAGYAVSPNLPRYIDIPALGIHTRVLSEGVSSKGQLQVPWNIYDTGWYNASAQPGQAGAMLIDGHSGIDGLHGVFYKLGSLAAGDQITVTRGDGQKFTYTVIKVQVVNVNDVDMQSMVVSADADAPGLNLITCTGDQIPGTDQLNERVQVYAVMQ